MPDNVRECMQQNWGGASFGIIAGNKVKAGGAQFWLGQASQIILEHNEFTGWGQVSGGNAIQTYRGGWSQHLYMGSNVVSDVWGADREGMTFDDNDVDYFGPLGSLRSDGRVATTPLYNRSAFSTSPVLGGAFVVVTGSMAGQWRRIIAASGGGPGLVRREYTLDRPIPGVEPSDWVTTIPFRGRMIFTDTTYRDTGVFQLYLVAIENIVAGMRGERMGGFAQWGQWSAKGFSQDNKHVDGRPFINPNLHTQWLGNEIRDGAHAFYDERSMYFTDLRWHGNANARLMSLDLLPGPWVFVECRLPLPVQLVGVRHPRRRDGLQPLVQHERMQLQFHRAAQPLQRLAPQHRPLQPERRCCYVLPPAPRLPERRAGLLGLAAGGHCGGAHGGVGYQGGAGAAAQPQLGRAAARQRGEGSAF